MFVVRVKDASFSLKIIFSLCVFHFKSVCRLRDIAVPPSV